MAHLIKLPDEWYIGLESDYDMKSRERTIQIFGSHTSVNPLGFMTPYGTDSAAKKRIETVDDWSGYSDRITASNQKEQGVILKNELLNGFKVLNTVTRWSTQNKLFRILDPRGFQLEISSGNLEMLIQNNTIENGVIKDKCVWGREGATNVLLSENSEPYKEAARNTKIETTKAFVDLSKLALGTRIRTKTDQQYYYGGKVWVGAVRQKVNKTGETRYYSYYHKPKTPDGELLGVDFLQYDFDPRPWQVLITKRETYASLCLARKPVILEAFEDDILEIDDAKLFKVRQYVSKMGSGCVLSSDIDIRDSSYLFFKTKAEAENFDQATRQDDYEAHYKKRYNLK